MLIETLIPIFSLIGLILIFFQIVKTLKIHLNYEELILYGIIFVSALLIIPWSFLGLQKNKLFFQSWPLFLSILGLSNLGLILYKRFKLIIKNLEFDKNLLKQINFTNQNSVILFIIGFLITFYTIFNLILPLRDFDAIWMYIPDAMWYYRSNSIPEFNPLNFRASTKEPFISLFLAYTLYTTGSLNIELLPILFIIGWMLTVYIFILKTWRNTNKALIGVLLFLVSPFVYYIFNFWVYYQEIYVAFFYSVTLLALYCILTVEKSLDTNVKNKLYVFYFSLGSLSFALTLLSKLSGWTLPIIVLILYPFSKKMKILQSFLLTGIFLFLIFKSSSEFYIGIGIIIFFYFLLVLGLLWKPRKYETQTIYSTQRTSWIGLAIIPFGLLLGGFWLFETFRKFISYGSGITNQYFSLQTLTFVTEFPATNRNSSHFLLESAHSANFFALVFYILVGNMFVLFWVVPKIRVIFDDQVKYFVLWTIGFFVIWLTYHSFSSVRYLSIILVPIVIIVTHGFFKLYEDITKNKKPESKSLLIVISASFLAFLSYYFPINLLNNQLNFQSINDIFLSSAFYYYTNSVFYLGLAILVTLSFLFIIKRTLNQKNFSSINFSSQMRKIKFVMILLIVSVPFTVPTVVLLSSGGNIDDFNSTMVYYQRPAYKEVVKALLEENSPSSGILVVDLPGLPIYLNQPTLDLYFQGKEVQQIFKTNISNILQILLNPLEFAQENFNLTLNENILSSSFSFDYVVIPSYENNFYNFYVSSLYKESKLFSLLFHQKLFRVVFENPEFIVFKRNYNDIYFDGIVNTYLSTNKTMTSIFGRVQTETDFQNDVLLKVEALFPDQHNANITINSTISLLGNDQLLKINSTYIKDFNTELNAFEFTIPLKLDQYNFRNLLIQNITLKVLIESNHSIISKNYLLESQNNGLELVFNQITNSWYVFKGIGLIPV